MPSNACPSRPASAGPRARPPLGLSARCCAAAALSLPFAAHASFLPPELVDQAATYLAWFILAVVPIAAIVLFWLVHILPEKVAEKRHHPQKDAIQMLCLLSLVFGGLLWPIAWLWAYTRPVGYRAAYGTDKHDEYFVSWRAGRGAASALEARSSTCVKSSTRCRARPARRPNSRGCARSSTAARRPRRLRRCRCVANPAGAD